VLTTASALVLLLLPFVIMGDVAGLEIVHPMAIVMLGGLATTTLLSLFLLPALYLRFGAGAQPDVEFQIASMRHWAGVEGEPVHGNERADEQVAGEPNDHRRFERAPERQADAAHQEQPAGEGSTPPTEEGGEGASPGKSSE
jgi:hypothetical protein